MSVFDVSVILGAHFQWISFRTYIFNEYLFKYTFLLELFNGRTSWMNTFPDTSFGCSLFRDIFLGVVLFMHIFFRWGYFSDTHFLEKYFFQTHAFCVFWTITAVFAQCEQKSVCCFKKTAHAFWATRSDYSLNPCFMRKSVCSKIFISQKECVRTS